MESGRHSICSPGRAAHPIRTHRHRRGDDVLVCLVSDRLFLFLSIRSVRPSGLASLSAGIHIINIIARRDMMKGVTTAARGADHRTAYLWASLFLPLFLFALLRLITNGPHPSASMSVDRPRARHVIHPGRQRGRRKRRRGETEADGGTDGWGCLFQLIPP